MSGGPVEGKGSLRLGSVVPASMAAAPWDESQISAARFGGLVPGGWQIRRNEILERSFYTVGLDADGLEVGKTVIANVVPLEVRRASSRPPRGSYPRR